MKFTSFKLAPTLVLVAALSACGGGGGGNAAAPASSQLTVTGTAATGLAIAGAAVTGKCKVGTGAATTLANGNYTLVVTDGQLPCVLQITNPIDGTKLHTLVSGTGNTAIANITPLTEMTTARVLGSEPNVFFAAFDANAATQNVTTDNIKAAQNAIGLIFTGTINTTGIGDFITTPLVAATQGSPNSGDTQDKLLDALKLKLSTAQIGTITTALAGNQTTDALKQTVINLTTKPLIPPVANAGATQSVVAGTTVMLDASTSSAAAGKSLTYAWTLTSKPTGSAATLAASNTAKPTFVADVAGSYVASVIVNDGTTASSATAISVTASVANAAPVANAGVAQNVVAGSIVTLDGSTSSDANGDMLTYAWTLTSKPAGSAAVLISSTSEKPTYTADIAGIYVVSIVVNDGKVNSATANTTITASTSIGGIIAVDTQLTVDKSPYVLTSTLQIAYGVTLTIGPGVTVRSHQGFPINVYGTLNISGTSSSYVQLDSVSINNNGTSENQSSSIQISYAKINSGKIMAPSGNASYGNIVLTDSVLTSVNSNGGFGYMYIWYPTKNCYIERNIFKNSGGLSVGVSSGKNSTKVYIKNNVFVGVMGTAVENWASYGGETTVVFGNSFLDIGKVVLSLPGGYTSAAITATNNYWGTTDQTQVQSRIYDKSNDLSSAGFVKFLPLLIQPDTLTPSYP